MRSATFLQVSDLHLGAPLRWLPAARRRERAREQQRALETAVARAVEERVDAILVPGDLFDRDGVDPETLAFAVHVFAVPGCPPVLIAPGNHDPWFEASACWSPRLLEARGWAWPEHVHVFAAPGWSRVQLPGVSVWGRCFSAGALATLRPLDPALLPAIDPREGDLHVAVFHGSREGFLPWGQKSSAPFTDAEVRSSPFHYLAVGHYHLPSAMAGERGSVRLAYAGSAVALRAGETGEHGALRVRLADDGAGPRVSIEPRVLDPRRTHELSVDVTGLPSADRIDRRIAERLDAEGVAAEDLVTVRLAGRIVRGVRYAPGEALAARAWFLRIDARATRPDYDLDAYRHREPHTTEDRFVRALLERLDREADPERRAVVEAAIYHGLDALRLGAVAPAYEEIEA